MPRSVELNRMEGKVAIITGGNLGIGPVIALRLASEGASIGLCHGNPRSSARFCSDGYLSDSRDPNILWFQEFGLAKHLTKDL